MSIFVIERDLPIALLIDAQREFDQLNSTVSAAETRSPAVLAGLYLAEIGRSVTILRATDEGEVRALLRSAGLRHALVHRAVHFPNLGFSPGQHAQWPVEPPVTDIRDHPD